jgi:uncharacterized circularly permuted ATP-grasp superfamily protein
MPYDEAAPQLDGDLKGLNAGVRGRLARSGVLFRSVSGRAAFPLDPIPRVIAETDWLRVAGALGQRVRALNAFVADAYGERRIVREGVVPERLIDTAEHYEPAMRGVRPPGDLWVGVAGLDLVRDGDGEFRVIEDNLLTPSGFGYVVAARDAILPELDPPADAAPRSFAALPLDLAGTLRAASPVEREPYLVVLTEPDNAARFEHAWAADALGIPLVELGDLRLVGDRLHHGEFAVDVVYRRADADMLDCDVGRLLEPAVRAGTLGVVNAYGCGVGDDKLAHAYVEDMVRFYLDEEPRIRSVPTLDLSRPEHLERALDMFDELVIKPRAGQGGQDVMIGPLAEADERDAIRERVRDSPEDWVAQEFVELSRHITLIDGELVPRYVDLRPFVFMQGPDDARVLAGGLTRFAIDEGAMIVNTSLRGGFKDTWVIP